MNLASRIASPSSLLLGLLLVAAQPGRADVVVDFDDLKLAPNSFWRGPDPQGTVINGPFGPEVLGRFASHGAEFVNRYNQTFGNWSGFAYSNTTDTTTPGYLNQFSAFTGTGRGPGADNYGIAFGYDDVAPNLFDPDPFDPTDPADLAQLPTLLLPDNAQIAGMYVTNTTYAALSMLLGDSFAKKFGGTTGDDPDYFLLSAYGTDAAGNPLANHVDFYLADYRFADNARDYIVADWTFMDLSALSGAHALHFNVSSSDAGLFGMNTPGYFAVDDILLVSPAAMQPTPEPSTLALAAIGGLVGLAALARRRRARGD